MTVVVMAYYVTCILFFSGYDAGYMSRFTVLLQRHVQPKQVLWILQISTRLPAGENQQL